MDTQVRGISFAQPTMPNWGWRPGTNSPPAGSLDRFQASLNGDVPAPSYKDMLKVVKPSANTTEGAKSPADSVLASLQSNQPEAAAKTLAGLSPADRLKVLAGLHRHDKEYKSLLSGVRSGAIKDESVTLGVGIDRLASSKWGSAKENQAIMDGIKKKYTSTPSELSYGKIDGGEALTSMGPKGVSSIKFDPSLAKSPEGMAATLAHEGQHAYRHANGTTKTDLQEEADANMTESRVWSQFDKDKYASVDNANNPWDATAKYFDPKKPLDDNAMLNHVASEYAGSYLKMAARGDSAKRERGAKMLEEYFDINAGRQGALLKAANKEQVVRLDTAAIRLGSGMDDQDATKITLDQHREVLEAREKELK